MENKTPSPLEKLHSLLSEDMQRVDEFIDQQIISPIQVIPDVSRYIIQSGGKRLRPLLTLTSCHLCDYQGSHHITLAAAIELMHIATLLHDDVVDDSHKRRKQPTVRMKWGNANSILVGDFLLGKAFQMMVSTNNQVALEVLSSASGIIAEGEILQLSMINNLDMSIEIYHKIITSKTAILFSAATQMGGILIQQEETIGTHLNNYGMHLGKAFQLIDDIIDYTNTTLIGKDKGNDFKEGKSTLPIIHAYQHANHEEKQFWERVIKDLNQNENDLEHAITLMNKHKSLEYCTKEATSSINQAKQALNYLPNNQYRDILADIADFCLTRQA